MHGISGQQFAIDCFVFALAVFVGFELITKVPAILHTPLMSATNAIHGIVLVLDLLPGVGIGQGPLEQPRVEARLAERRGKHCAVVDVGAALVDGVAEGGVEPAGGAGPVLGADEHHGAQGGGGPPVVDGASHIAPVADGEREHRPVDRHLAELLEPAHPTGRLVAPRAERIEVEADGLGHVGTLRCGADPS